MPTITLPDGSKRSFDHPVTGADVARDIGAGLAKAALAMRLNGALVDLAKTIDTDAEVAIITSKSPEALEVLRHDVAHLMAEAVKELYPDTQVTIGPAIENGFYYDFARAHPFTPDDLEKIEKRMHEIVARDEPITREEWQRDDAVKFFSDQGEKYKAEIIAGIPATEPIGLYRQGNFIDLCRGPHLPSTGKVGKAFKLMKVAGAYWRGDSKNAMLQRIYGTAWFDEKQLNAYLTQIEEAEKRDHRRIGKEMDLFHLQEEAAGSVFWHPHGWTIYRLLENFIRTRLDAAGYVEVRTPQLVDRSLFVASGHWDMYGDNMYKVAFDDGNRMFGVKPMNCPCHIQIFNQGMKSYRDLPIRMAEFGSCHRNEPSGALHGIMRVRAFTQDDAHIFCTPEQIADESIAFCKLTMDAYRDLGFTDVAVKLATRPDKRLGTDAIWDRAEAGLAAAVEAAGLAHEVLPGEGAFYGPKLEFHLRDSIGRSWQCGTLQLDFNLPERLGSTYIAEDGAKHTPVMLHRAVLGSLERFIGMLIEHYAGRFPLWLAPVQAVVTTITDDAIPYAQEVAEAMKAAGLRVQLDLSNNKINYKVREHSLAKVPVLAVVGKREAETRSVALRHLGGADQEVLALEAAVAKLAASGRPPGAAH